MLMRILLANSWWSFLIKKLHFFLFIQVNTGNDLLIKNAKT